MGMENRFGQTNGLVRAEGALGRAGWIGSFSLHCARKGGELSAR